MGWISKRSFQRGCSLYNDGPKKKGPLRKIISLTSFDFGIFSHSTGWLECGHWSDRIYGEKKAICVKCAERKPKDKKRKDGWPEYKKGDQCQTINQFSNVNGVMSITALIVLRIAGLRVTARRSAKVRIEL